MFKDFSEQEIAILAKLIGTAEVVINGIRKPKDWDASVNNLAEKILRECYRNLPVKEKSFEEYHDNLYDDVMGEYLETYEKAVWGSAAAQAVADAEFPVNGGVENGVKNLIAADLYDKAIEKHGASIVKINAPDFEKTFKILYETMQGIAKKE